jgi:mannose/cellobiose epimerase-like protein (N-acyl-D-glucosamine 2-epimerase family)
MMLGVAVSLGASCGDEGPSTDGEGTPTLALQVDTFDAPLVRAPEWFDFDGMLYPHGKIVQLVVSGAEAARVPVGEAQVVVDLPDGTRLQEATTDLMGRVRFEGLDLEQWPADARATVTVFKQGLTMHTWADVARPTSSRPVELTMLPRWQERPERFVTISGVTEHLQNSVMLVMPDHPAGASYQGQGDAWSITVPAGEPFGILATQWTSPFWFLFSKRLNFFGWAYTTHPPVEENTVVDIDWEADRIEPIPFSGSFTIAERPDSPVGVMATEGFSSVLPMQGDWPGKQRGSPTRVLRTESTVAFEGERVEPTSDVDWTVWFVETPNGTTDAFRLGPPDGELPGLLDVVEWTTESTRGHPIDEALEWAQPNDDVVTELWVADQAGFVPWVIRMPIGATSFVLPAPPSGVELDEVLGDAPYAVVASSRRFEGAEGTGGSTSWGARLALELEPETDPLEDLPTAADWRDHVEDQLLPYWTMEAARGDPVGNFPSFRCNDGTVYDDPDNRCPELRFAPDWIRASLGRQFVRMMSRQTYLYGAAYHMTGDPELLALHQAGVAQLRARALDPAGGAYSWFEEDGSPGPDPSLRTSQDLSYALVGLAMNYYLTRDPAVLQDILQVKEFIFAQYWDDDLGMLKWTQANPNGEQELVAQLDQINAYLLLSSRILPAEDSAAWNADLVELVDILRDDYYDEALNVFWGAIHDPARMQLGAHHTDFGHSIKSLWMIHGVGRLLDDATMEDWAAQRMALLFEDAYLFGGTWAPNHFGSDMEWWAYAELDQAAATLALEEPEMLEYLATTYPAFFERLVDHEHGGVFHSVPASGAVNPSFAKCHLWKNGYHEFEHALVGLITGQGLRDEPLELWFAFADDAVNDVAVPYFYEGEIVSRATEAAIDGYTPTRVTFDGIR